MGLVVFDKYMKLVRRLQSTYRMEPAGSQGVWSLDDYQFVAFIWGAAQMVGHARIKPKSIADYDIADMLAPDYHMFSCIKVIISIEHTIPYINKIGHAKYYLGQTCAYQ